eukprot:4994368-Ditylum_brightwellii.AAC.1
MDKKAKPKWARDKSNKSTSHQGHIEGEMWQIYCTKVCNNKLKTQANKGKNYLQDWMKNYNNTCLDQNS